MRGTWRSRIADELSGTGERSPTYPLSKTITSFTKNTVHLNPVSRLIWYDNKSSHHRFIWTISSSDSQFAFHVFRLFHKREIPLSSYENSLSWKSDWLLFGWKTRKDQNLLGRYGKDSCYFGGELESSPLGSKKREEEEDQKKGEGDVVSTS